MEQNKTSKEEANAQGIRAVMCDRIKGEFDRLITKQIDPWIFFNNKGFLVKKFNLMAKRFRILVLNIAVHH